jgi:hypothetical protein
MIANNLLALYNHILLHFGRSAAIKNGAIVNLAHYSG